MVGEALGIVTALQSSVDILHRLFHRSGIVPQLRQMRRQLTAIDRPVKTFAVQLVAIHGFLDGVGFRANAFEILDAIEQTFDDLFLILALVPLELRKCRQLLFEFRVSF